MKKIGMVLIFMVLMVPCVGWGINPPTLSGLTYATAGEQYHLYIPGGDECYVDWGDGTNSGWLPAFVGPKMFPSLHCSGIYTWISPGIYTVMAKLRNRSTLIESDWSNSLAVTVQPASNIIGSLEGPSDTVSGVNTIYGWAIHPQGIAKVELYIDDQLIGNIAYGGSRPDIKASYPDYPNAENSGFATIHDFSSLSQGTNIVAVRIYNQDGQFKDLSASVNIIKFHGDSVESMSPDQRWLRTNRVTADGITKTYDILIEWDYELQEFKIGDIVKKGR